MYYIVYKTTNDINGKIYVGVHATKNMKDGYIGSGRNITFAIKKYGKENFTREILYVFDNPDDMFAKEGEIVNEEFILRDDTYNIALGGGRVFMLKVKDMAGNEVYINQASYSKNKDKYIHHNAGLNTNSTVVYDPVLDEGERIYFRVPIDDERVLNGELKSCTYGLASAIDPETGKMIKVAVDDPRWETGEFKGNTHGTAMVRPKNDPSAKCFRVPVDDPRYISGELVQPTSGRVTVKDKNGNTLSVSKDDPRYISGELVGINTGKRVMCNDELDLNKNVPADKVDEFLADGWRFGRIPRNKKEKK